MTAHAPRRGYRVAVPAQFARYCVVGAGNTAITLGVFWVLERAAVWYPLASALAFLAGAANGFRLNRRWTFRTAGSFPRYVGVQLTGLGLDVALVAGFVAVGDVPHLAAQIAALPLVCAMSFALSRRIAFAEARV